MIIFTFRDFCLTFFFLFIKIPFRNTLGFFVLRVNGKELFGRDRIMNESQLRIAICDDNASDRKNIRSLCDDYFSSQNIDTIYSEYSTGSAILEEKEKIDLLFLDIELGDMNGIYIMKELEKGNNVWKIIFTTGHDRFMPDAFGSRTLGFLVKPVNPSQLGRYLSLFQKELLLLAQPAISLPKHKSVSLTDILYIESSGSYFYLTLASDSEKITCSGSIKNFIKSLNTNIIVCVRKGSYVNLYHVVSNTDHSVTLSNGETKPITATYYDDFKDQLMLFIRNYRR